MLIPSGSGNGCLIFESKLTAQVAIIFYHMLIPSGSGNGCLIFESKLTASLMPSRFPRSWLTHRSPTNITRFICLSSKSPFSRASAISRTAPLP
uniref:Uncharacterized protein n=1 Tax=Setaria italica TaxID=4555 RepID=K3XTW3_SETIT